MPKSKLKPYSITGAAVKSVNDCTLQMEPNDDCYTVFTTGLQLMEQNTEPFKWFIGMQQEVQSQNTDCFINIYRQMGQEKDEWSVLVQVHRVSSFHCQTPFIIMSHFVESPRILSDFLWWWQYVNFLCFMDHGITLLELLKSHHSVGMSLWGWSQAGKRAFAFSNSVSL